MRKASTSAASRRARAVIDEAECSKVAVDSWFPSIYDCLRDIARRRMHEEAPGHTLQATALVHDAYVTLRESHHVNWSDRTHVLATAARALREVLVDHARRKTAAKRGGGWGRIGLDEDIGAVPARPEDMVALDEALARLFRHHGRCARVVELRFFGGLTIAEVSELLGLSPGTVKQDWRFARAWLHSELNGTVS